MPNPHHSASRGAPAIASSPIGDAERQAADLNASRIGAIAFHLRTGTREGSEERLTLGRQAAAALVRQGLIPAEALQRLDLTDAGLEAIERQAAQLKGSLAELGRAGSPPHVKKGGRRAFSAAPSPYRTATGATSFRR
jgi:hypothetical protein